MTEAFDEEIFLYALTSRPEDAKKFAQTFKPLWLNKAELIPLLVEIYDFTKKNGEPPSIPTLHKIFKDRDEEAYNLRYKNSIEGIAASNPDRSEILYVLDKANDVGIIRDFLDMASDQAFLRNQSEFQGKEVLKTIQSFFYRHGELGDDRTLDIKQTIDLIVEKHGFENPNKRIPCGIKEIDNWCGGGLRPAQMGLIMGVTGGGKSVSLIVMAHKMASIEQKNVWVITNELTLEQVGERFMSRLTGKDISDIIDDPGIAYHGLGRHWQSGLHNRLRITEVNREVSADWIESEMSKWRNIMGWKPDVIVLDFMERMKPCDSGFSREKEWIWLGAIAKDLIRLSKRHNLLIWTACQTNREGLSANALTLAHGQSSTRHFQEVTVVIGLNQIPTGEEDKVYMQFTPLKFRESKKPGKPVLLECDLSKMNISNNVVDITEYDDEGEVDNVGNEEKTPRQKQKAKRNRV